MPSFFAWGCFRLFDSEGARQHPLTRVSQYSKLSVIESRGRGVLDPPLSRRMTRLEEAAPHDGLRPACAGTTLRDGATGQRSPSRPCLQGRGRQASDVSSISLIEISSGWPGASCAGGRSNQNPSLDSSNSGGQNSSPDSTQSNDSAHHLICGTCWPQPHQLVNPCKPSAILRPRPDALAPQ
jgi:hypothetical protein